ncbi:TcpQ domain-containing protein [Rheinheimera maricola]|uniref:Toxin co-regulated pilus biosynthesis Q family protein n=1 Tax=Rheinheimera maricola TaxID=2793282 RepID=A0ABS7X9X7_9GAMM|nr:TcpQ domain-containing protein [Rheinheimera maricola]MBZ9612363.1 toxin co-regulated pilus biosynthesis Q family protein [Rheinheimera maricola]
MWFWIRNIILLLLLGGIGYVLLTKPDLILRTDKVNQAAAGFSEFYSKVRGSVADGARELSKFKLTLPDTSDKLTQTLQQRALVVVPGKDDWRGKVTDRRFREGDTVKTKLAEYARAEGVELFWTLPRDYVIKQYFQVNGSLIATVHQIAQAIAPDFQSPVLSFYCPKERAAVITDKTNEHLTQHCVATQNDVPAQ